MELKELFFCCNPFRIDGHKRHKKNLRKVQMWMVNMISGITIDHKICDGCRKKLTQKKVPVVEATTSDATEITDMHNSSTSSSLDDSDTSVAPNVALLALNDSLVSLGESPVKKKRLIEKKYCKNKFDKVSEVFQSTYVPIVDKSAESETNAESEIVRQLKEKFSSCTRSSEKIQILTVLPKSWSIRRIQKEFGASNYLVRKAKELVKECGIFATPNPRPGRILSKHTENLVLAFYNRDDISRCLPGKKDFVSVLENETKVHRQKRLVLGNLKEVYQLFKDEHPELKIGLSKFCQLRPKYCVLAGACGTHSVCICSIHQNVKLMVEGSRLKDLTRDADCQLNTYKHCLAQIICNPAQPKCYMSSCENCPGIHFFMEYLANLFEENGIDEITYKLWTSTDRTTLQTFVSTVEEFLEMFAEKLQQLLPHSFIATQQSQFLKDLKEKLCDNEYIILCDFAENYAFVLQDEVQGFHWNNAQATIHPFVIYYRNPETLALDHISFVIISECLKHDTVSVHLFQRHLINFMKFHFNRIPKYMYYFSDGSAAQYKNRKNFSNICYHQSDFTVRAEWHYFATSHGKEPCDGIAGTIKRLAARASLQCSYNSQIITPRQLFAWCSKNITLCHFHYTTNAEYDEEESLLQSRFEKIRTIAGTQKVHCVIPAGHNTIQIKCFSNSPDMRNESLTLNSQESDLNNITGFVACMYEGHWWLGCVLNVNDDNHEVKLSFLHPHGPSPSFIFPEKPDIFTVHKKAILTKVDVRTPTGRTYVITPKDVQTVLHLASQY